MNSSLRVALGAKSSYGAVFTNRAHPHVFCSLTELEIGAALVVVGLHEAFLLIPYHSKII